MRRMDTMDQDVKIKNGKIDTRSVDDLGRVVLPKTLRIKYGIAEGDEVAFFDSGDAIAIRKARSSCAICHSLEDLRQIDRETTLCAACLQRIKSL
jgi:transcriptional pleiotropic regulator of transition state genes